MISTVLRRGGIIVGTLVGLVLLVILVAAVTDRPRTDPLRLDREAPVVQAYLDAERALLAHHGLDFAEHDVTVADPGLRVRVLEVGDGPPVLVLPPAPGEAAWLAPLLTQLGGYRYLLVNLPGGGASDGVDLRAVDHRDLARRTLDGVYDHFGLDQVPIVGGSVGGTWALWYGLDRPDRVTLNIQLGAPAAVEGTTVPGMLGVLGVPGLNRIVAATMRPPVTALGHPPETAAVLPPVAHEFERALQQLPTYPLTWRSLGLDSFRLGGLGGWESHVEIGRTELADLSHPTLLVWPANDPFGDIDVGHRLAAHLPDAELHVAGVGHLPWLDDPAGVAELITQFLSTHNPGE